jgi:hypothetical protein
LEILTGNRESPDVSFEVFAIDKAVDNHMRDVVSLLLHAVCPAGFCQRDQVI